MGVNTNKFRYNHHPDLPPPKDEVGFAIQPETAIRGFCPVYGGYDLPFGYTQSVKGLAYACRGHPSVFSYSLMNECDPRSIPALLDNISTVDSQVPFVWNDDKYVPRCSHRDELELYYDSSL